MTPEMEAPGSAATDQAHKGNNSTAIVPTDDAERKAAATAIARAAMAGVAVYELADGRFLAVLGVAHQLHDLDALAGFVGRLEGAS